MRRLSDGTEAGYKWVPRTPGSVQSSWVEDLGGVVCRGQWKVVRQQSQQETSKRRIQNAQVKPKRQASSVRGKLKVWQPEGHPERRLPPRTALGASGAVLHSRGKAVSCAGHGRSSTTHLRSLKPWFSQQPWGGVGGGAGVLHIQSTLKNITYWFLCLLIKILRPYIF